MTKKRTAKAKSKSKKAVIRAPGFYFVRIKDFETSLPVACEWNGCYWLVPGTSDTYDDSQIIAIGPRLKPSVTPLREPGYYWVMYSSESDWVVAEWNGNSWVTFGVDYDEPESTFEIVGARVKPPPKPIIGSDSNRT